jgi:hypothetical protein
MSMPREHPFPPTIIHYSATPQFKRSVLKRYKKMSDFALMGSAEASLIHDDESERARWRKTPGMDRDHVACDALNQRLHFCLLIYEPQYRSSGSDTSIH